MNVAVKAARYTIAVVFFLWLLGTALAVWASSATPQPCAFRIWAAWWPVFIALPKSTRLEFVLYSFQLCGIK